MTTPSMRVRHGGWLAVLLLALMLWATALPLHAAEPPPGSSAADQAQRQVERPLNNAPVWRAVRSGEEHFTTVRVRSRISVRCGLACRPLLP